MAQVDRVWEGMYAEYGRPTLRSVRTELSEREQGKRDALFAVGCNEGADRSTGVWWLHPLAWDVLLWKLLHTMVTNDELYVVT